MYGGFYISRENGALKGTIFLSLLLHVALLALFFLSPSFPSHRISIGPVYDVALVDFPGGASSMGYSGAAAGGLPASEGKLKTTKRVQTTAKRSLPTLPEVPVARIERRTGDSRSLEKAIESIKRKAAAEGNVHKEPAVNHSSASSAAGENTGVGTTEKTGTAVQAGSGAADGASGGEGGGDAKVNAYYREIWLRIRAQWALPGGMLPKEPLESVISIMILRTGAVTEARFEKASGNRYFDESAMRAVHKANPLPPLPVWLNGSSLNVGIRFHSSELNK
jgi:TonB family protein